MNQHLQALREAMRQHNLDAYLIPSTDPHQSEYVAKRWEARAFLTGFDGSAGTAVVTRDFAGLWTDSRYFIQARQQLEGSGFELMKLVVPHTPEHIHWLVDTLPAGARVGVDGRVISVASAEELEEALGEKDIALVTEKDLMAEVWQDRPGLPDAPIFEHALQYAGLSRQEKLAQLREKIRKEHVDYALITALDDIAWLFNLRGGDVDFNPVFLAYALVSGEQAWLCVDEQKMEEALREKLSAEGLTLRPYDSIGALFAELPEGGVVYYDPEQTHASLAVTIWDRHEEKEGPSLVAGMKGAKNETECQHVRQVMVRDGVAMVEFLHWLGQAIGKETITESSAAEKLLSFRASKAQFVGESFPAISGYGPNGAIVHYHARAGQDATLKPEGIYLIDSGGQYLDGTTDITRTVALGPVPDQAKDDFTRVLQGCIDLSMAIFPKGTCGHQLDILARKPLWDAGLNYGHGTGHGVGFFLNVHEGPQRISSAGNDLALVPGMITSNEPGLYREGEYGMRVENLILVTENGPASDFGTFYSFETLTLCPIDQRLINPEQLTSEARQWLNAYHQRVWDTLHPHLEPEPQAWLKEACKAL